MATTTHPLTDLDTSQITGFADYDKYVAVRTRQGGRTVYTVQLPLAAIPRVLPVPDPGRPTPGNRRVSEKHAKDFGVYLRARPDWVAPPLLIRDDGQCKFEEQVTLPGGIVMGILHVPRNSGLALKIIDGQHRILGIDHAVKDLNLKIAQAKDRAANARYRKKNGEAILAAAGREIAELEATLKRFSEEHLSVEIYVEDAPMSYEQMFFDVADHALGINQAVKVRFDSTKVINRTIDEACKHALLDGRVDLEQDRIKGANPNLVGAKHVADIVRAANVGVVGRMGKRREASLDEGALVENTNAFLDALADAFPTLDHLIDGRINAQDVRDTSLLGSVTTLRILAGVWHELTTREVDPVETDEVRDYFARLAPHMAAPIAAASIWMTSSDGRLDGVFGVGAYAPGARAQQMKDLTKALRDWYDTPPSGL